MPQPPTVNIQLSKNLSAATGELQIEVNLKIKSQSFVALYGKSGVGKTSILRMVAGLMSPERGRIYIGNKTWLDSAKKIQSKPQQREVGMLFQDYALFPNMTIRQNLEFALSKKQDTAIIDELIEMMELTGLQHRHPATLSGGQQQRVALARALVQQPTLLLLDEPLSALDDEMRQKLQDFILEVHRRYQLTTILVSHDQREIERMADRVLVLENGKIIADGTPREVFYKNYPPPRNGQVVSTENVPSYVWGEICQGWQLVNTPQLSVIQETMPPHTAETRHAHQYAQQFFYILKGEATFYINHQKQTVSTNQGIHILPQTVHQIKNESKETLSFLVISQPHSHHDRIYR